MSILYPNNRTRIISHLFTTFSRRLPILLLALGTALTVPSNAGAPIGGLTVTMSPDGATLVASGDPRTLYVIDAATLEVKNRVWVETSVSNLVFGPSASSLN
jgi:WD40 repeat protein